MVRHKVSALVAPNANEPSLIALGIRDKPSSVATITTGTVSNAKVRDAHNNPPDPKVGDGNASE